MEGNWGGGGLGGKGRVNQGFVEGTVPVQSGKGWRWEDVAIGEITLEVAKMPEDYVLFM